MLKGNLKGSIETITAKAKKKKIPGPLGTFSESAAIKHFGHAARLFPQDSIDGIFRVVEARHADYAVVPTENSTEGAIGRVMDLLMTTPLRICGEVLMRIFFVIPRF